jgi:hypothetical protein
VKIFFIPLEDIHYLRGNPGIDVTGIQHEFIDELKGYILTPIFVSRLCSTKRFTIFTPKRKTTKFYYKPMYRINYGIKNHLKLLFRTLNRIVFLFFPFVFIQNAVSIFTQHPVPPNLSSLKRPLEHGPLHQTPQEVTISSSYFSSRQL